MAAEGTYKAYFRGNGANVVKNVPETALKLTCNDRVKATIASDGHTVSLGRTSSPFSLPVSDPACCGMHTSTVLARQFDATNTQYAFLSSLLLLVLACILSMSTFGSEQSH